MHYNLCFQLKSSAWTAQWLMSHPPDWIWIRCYCQPTANIKYDQGPQAHGKKKYFPLLTLMLWFIFSNINLQPDHSMTVNPAPSLNMEMRCCDPTVNNQNNRDSKRKVRKYVFRIFYFDMMIYLFQLITYAVPMPWFISQPPDWIRRHHGSRSVNNNNTQGEWVHGEEKIITIFCFDFLLWYFPIKFLPVKLAMIHIPNPGQNMETPSSSSPHEQK